MSKQDCQFTSSVFPTQDLSFGKDGKTKETIVRGGRDKISLLKPAFIGNDIEKIGVIGWGSQGPAQAQNLRDSLEGSGVRVTVGLRSDSRSIQKAQEKGFTSDNGTLGEMHQVIQESDLTILLISDAAQAKEYPEIFNSLQKGSILGLSHGFLQGHLTNQREWFPDHIGGVVMCAPKGMGPSVRRLYEQDSGINCSFAVEGLNNEEQLQDIALGWGVALGAPTIFKTTLKSEYRSDIFGERGILLGAVWGIIEFLFRYFRASNPFGSYEEAFRESAECITGPLSRFISHHGLLAVYEAFVGKDKVLFEQSYSTAYPAALELLTEIYEEVASGNEIRSVVMAGDRLNDFPMGRIDNTITWITGENVRLKRDTDPVAHINPITAGVYIATMMAQIAVLEENEHPVSEQVNETIIEAVDSLNPYMHHKGVAHMVDNCSTTARLGARKWAPRFDYLFTQKVALPLGEVKGLVNTQSIEQFKTNAIHHDAEICRELRPPIDIALA
ncbi:MAG: ketol-acid reductoisomerase [Patescibacteria group bacterium]